MLFYGAKDNGGGGWFDMGIGEEHFVSFSSSRGRWAARRATRSVGGALEDGGGGENGHTGVDVCTNTSLTWISDGSWVPRMSARLGATWRSHCQGYGLSYRVP